MPLALLLASGLAAQSSEPGLDPELIVHFPLASATLSTADEAALRALCDRADIARVTGVTLKGHTDLRGGLGYNEALSERRAEAVRAVLAGSCLKDRSVTLDWSGELEPLATGDDELDHAANRRVEVVLTVNDAIAVPQRHAKVEPLMPMADKTRQTFTCDPSEAIAFTAGDGVKVRIPQGAIVDANGMTVTGPVDISYRSLRRALRDHRQRIPMHMNTPEGVGHFETAGMYELYASQNGRPLSLKPGARIGAGTSRRRAIAGRIRDVRAEQRG